MFIRWAYHIVTGVCAVTAVSCLVSGRPGTALLLAATAFFNHSLGGKRK